MATLKLNLKQVPILVNTNGTSISAFQWVKVTMFVSIFKDSYPTSKREKDWGVIGWVFPILYSLSFLKARAFSCFLGVLLFGQIAFAIPFSSPLHLNKVKSK